MPPARHENKRNPAMKGRIEKQKKRKAKQSPKPPNPRRTRCKCNNDERRPEQPLHAAALWTPGSAIDKIVTIIGRKPGIVFL